MKRVDLEQWRAREVARLLALVEAERRYYQEIVASVPVGLAVLADDLTLLSANRTFRTIFDIGADGLGRVRLSDIFPDDSVRRRVAQVLETGTPQLDITIEAAVGGSAKPIRLSIQPFRGWNDESGTEALLLVEEAVDTEPPLQLEWNEEEAEPKTDTAGELLENLDAIVWERDAKSQQFTYVAGRTEEILGYAASQWLSTPRFFTDRVHPEDRQWLDTFYQQALTSATSRSCEYRAIDASGKIVWLRDVVRVRLDSKGVPVKLAGITVDISAQRQLGEQAVQTEKMAALSRLASKVTHDCNNLLMIMSGYGEELQSSLPEDHPSRDDVKEILAATGRLSKITNELLTFTRRPMLLPRVTDLNSVIEGLEEQLRREVGEAIEFDFDLAADLSQATVDSDAIANSILRLAECSRDAMEDGGRIQIRTANTELADGSQRAGGVIPPGHYVTISVIDTGPALDAEHRTRLFEPFYSGPRAGRALPNLYSVIKNSHGDIEVASPKGGGAMITIYLPQAAEPAPSRETRIPAPIEKPAVQPMETVLVVEDENGIRALMRKILQKQGYNVLEASRGDEALEIS
ncbi:MAG: PAS domain-containing protein, partial [bacterium]|nr:PAS domain-containing protein [bacterium]